jgi:hypothetical protein
MQRCCWNGSDTRKWFCSYIKFNYYTNVKKVSYNWGS